MILPPHIPGDATQTTTPAARASRTPYIATTILIAALSGLVAGLAYTAYGPSTRPIISSETRIERTSTETIEERRVKNAQESVAVFYGDKIDQPLATATAITGDGWFITTAAAAAKTKRVIIHPRAMGTVEKIVIDPASHFAFVKTSVRDARLLDSTTLENIPRGSRLAIILAHTAIPVTLQDARACVTDRCPSEFGDRISFAATIVEPLQQFAIDGAPVITTRGELVGIAERRTNNNVIIIPIDQVRAGFESAFARGVANRPTFPVRVTNATRTPVLTLANTLIARGFVVEQSTLSELKEGDIITHINRQPVEASASLFELVSTVYSLGTATLTLERKNAPLEITITLKKI